MSTVASSVRSLFPRGRDDVTTPDDPLQAPMAKTKNTPAALAPPPSLAPEADVFIQAGHQNAPPGKPQGAEGKYGAERDWTRIVADEATRILTAAGVTVIREDASLLLKQRENERFKAKVAVF